MPFTLLQIPVGLPLLECPVKDDYYNRQCLHGFQFQYISSESESTKLPRPVATLLHTTSGCKNDELNKLHHPLSQNLVDKGQAQAPKRRAATVPVPALLLGDLFVTCNTITGLMNPAEWEINRRRSVVDASSQFLAHMAIPVEGRRAFFVSEEDAEAERKRLLLEEYHAIKARRGYNLPGPLARFNDVLNQWTGRKAAAADPALPQGVASAPMGSRALPALPFLTGDATHEMKLLRDLVKHGETVVVEEAKQILHGKKQTSPYSFVSYVSKIPCEAVFKLLCHQPSSYRLVSSESDDEVLQRSANSTARLDVGTGDVFVDNPDEGETQSTAPKASSSSLGGEESQKGTGGKTPVFRVPGLTVSLRTNGGDLVRFSPAFLSLTHLRSFMKVVGRLTERLWLGQRHRKREQWRKQLVSWATNMGGFSATSEDLEYTDDSEEEEDSDTEGRDDPPEARQLLEELGIRKPNGAATAMASTSAAPVSGVMRVMNTIAIGVISTFALVVSRAADCGDKIFLNTPMGNDLAGMVDTVNIRPVYLQDVVSEIQSSNAKVIAHQEAATTLSLAATPALNLKDLGTKDASTSASLAHTNDPQPTAVTSTEAAPKLPASAAVNGQSSAQPADSRTRSEAAAKVAPAVATNSAQNGSPAISAPESNSKASTSAISVHAISTPPSTAAALGSNSSKPPTPSIHASSTEHVHSSGKAGAAAENPGSRSDRTAAVSSSTDPSTGTSATQTSTGSSTSSASTGDGRKEHVVGKQQRPLPHSSTGSQGQRLDSPESTSGNQSSRHNVTEKDPRGGKPSAVPASAETTASPHNQSSASPTSSQTMDASRPRSHGPDSEASSQPSQSAAIKPQEASRSPPSSQIISQITADNQPRDQSSTVSTSNKSNVSSSRPEKNSHSQATDQPTSSALIPSSSRSKSGSRSSASNARRGSDLQLESLEGVRRLLAACWLVALDSLSGAKGGALARSSSVLLETGVRGTGTVLSIPVDSDTGEFSLIMRVQLKRANGSALPPVKPVTPPIPGLRAPSTDTAAGTIVAEPSAAASMSSSTPGRSSRRGRSGASDRLPEFDLGLHMSLNKIMGDAEEEDEDELIGGWAASSGTSGLRGLLLVADVGLANFPKADDQLRLPSVGFGDLGGLCIEPASVQTSTVQSKGTSSSS